MTYFENPRPSIRTTIQVFDNRTSGCSKERTYSYLMFVRRRSSSSSCKRAARHPTHQRGKTGAYFELAISQRLVVYLTKRNIVFAACKQV